MAIDDSGGRTGFPANRFAAFYIELMMHEIKRAIPTPQVEIIVQRRARRQVFRDGPPLTTGGENIPIIYMRPFTTSRMIIARLSPPRLFAEVAEVANDCGHIARFSFVHVIGPCVTWNGSRA